MTHDFFKAKRSWSKYKDFILNYYLEPYIPKVATLKKPILIVDCFAGCGKFEDGEHGSPLIIASIIRKWRAKGVNVSGEFIEADQENFERLRESLAEFSDFATPRSGTFGRHLPELAARARHNTVFLYVDPYTVKGLVFDRMKAVYDQIRRASASVEVLLNLNVATFMRWGLAALKRYSDLPGKTDDPEPDFQADDPCENVEMATLDGIAGGDWWRTIAGDPTKSFVEKLNVFTGQYRKQMLSSFSFIASHEIKSKYEHTVPKYILVFATRHQDGVALMNDAMCKARREFLGNQFSKGLLFDLTPEREVADLGELGNEIESLAREKGNLTRGSLRNQAMWRHFGQYTSTDFNSAITSLLKQKRLFSSTGKSRINDSVMLSTKPFPGQET